ncbi:MAG: cardiolipin synthase [Treponema sp.]|jgi:cardiolipin synthase|nr:cardiolipin synthase [Treponema sp.]
MLQKWIRVFFKRRILFIGVLLIQLVFIVFVLASSSRAFRYADYGLNALSLVVSLHILNKREKSAYKLTWIFIIMLFPIFGGVIYVVFHTQNSPKKLKQKLLDLDKQFRPFYLIPGDKLPLLEETFPECKNQTKYLQQYAGFPVYTNTETQYFGSGELFFERVLEELKKAEKYIFLEFFILKQGQMLDPIVEILERKANQGLDVRIMYDDLGCFMTLPSNYKDQLEQKGIKCTVFNPFKPVLSSLQNNRDHRKIISIDGKTAFTGGINIADEYINARERFGHWKDSGIMISGEAAWSLTLIFLEMWEFYRSEKKDINSYYPWTDKGAGINAPGFVQPYADSPIDEENVGEHVYVQIINNAREYVYINTPYLVPGGDLLSALSLAAKSGVDVRIITPHRWDKKIVAITSRSFYRQLILAGVKVYEYTQGFNHSKTFVSDDKTATVGTTNLDYRSLYLHFECGVWMYKTSSVLSVKEDFIKTLPLCHEVTLKDCARNALQRVIQDVLRLFAPLM